MPLAAVAPRINHNQPTLPPASATRTNGRGRRGRSGGTANRDRGHAFDSQTARRLVKVGALAKPHNLMIRMPSRPSRSSRRRRQARLSVQPLESRRVLASYIVDTAVDVVADDGMVSLREAVQAANDNVQVNDAAAGQPGDSGADVIQFAEGIARRFQLTSPLVVSDDLQIAASSERTITLDAGGGSRVLEVSGEASLTISNLVITGGLADSGGGILVGPDSALTADSIEVIDNVATGDDADQGGGGIYNDGGTVMITSSTLSRNIANGDSGSGGALMNNAGILTLGEVDLSDNQANRAGGGIEATADSTTIAFGGRWSTNVAGPAGTAAPGNGGGLHITGNGEATLTNLSVDGNVAAAEGGGLWNGSGLMTLADVFVTNNLALGDAADNGGGGVFNEGGTITIARGRITGNEASGDAGSGGGVFNNAGIVTLTDVIVNQNIANRAGGGIEATAGSQTDFNSGSLIQNVAGPTDSAAPGNGGGLHITGDGDASIIDSLVSNNSAAAEGGGLWNGAGNMVVSSTVFNANQASGDDADQGGGALFNQGGQLVVSASSFTGNVALGASGSGGGILNTGSLTVIGSTFDANIANRAGGGIESTAGTQTTLTDIDAVDNVAGPDGTAAPGNGGFFHITGDGDATITNLDAATNRAAAEGGALWNGTGNMHVSGSTLSDNVASGDDSDQGGGGLFNQGGRLVIENVDVTGNVANGQSGSGGGLLNNGGSVSILRSNFDQNESNRAGGAIEDNAGQGLDLIDSTLTSNTTGASPGNGGGVHITGAGSVDVIRTTISGNSAAAEGGGVWNSMAGTMFVRDSIITGNSAPIGGGVFIDGESETVTVQTTDVSNNSVDDVAAPNDTDDGGGDGGGGDGGGGDGGGR